MYIYIRFWGSLSRFSRRTVWPRPSIPLFSTIHIRFFSFSRANVKGERERERESFSRDEPVNSRSGEKRCTFLHVYNRSSLVSVVLEKLPDALEEKPGQMTSGVPFHYAGNVKAQLSQWLYPWCKGNSVISFFSLPSVSLSLFLRDHPPSLPRFPALDGGDIYRRTANRVPFVSEKFARHILLSRRILGEEEGRRQMMERS